MKNKSSFNAGKYRSYKGKNYYIYCLARDNSGNQYVLYQQLYDEKEFWIRPYDLFFETINVAGQDVARFQYIKGQKTADNTILQLVFCIENDFIYLRETESKALFCISSIDTESKEVIVQPVKENSCGYLSNVELLHRMGYYVYFKNKEKKYVKVESHYKPNQLFYIGDNHIEMIKKTINPCSIDLQITDSGFLKSKRRTINPQSIDNIVKSKKHWANKRVCTSKKGLEYIRIKPHETVVTHTKEKLVIPNDCAGKVTIKSTFARLSLSITSSDFCNPGYKGYFPFEITNNSNNTIIIHVNETMAQIMLIPVQGVIFHNYSEVATYKNEKGEDDGTPYAFWQERSLKLFRETQGSETLIQIYNIIKGIIPKANPKNINEAKERFDNTFIPFCHKKITKKKYLGNDNKPIIKKIVNAYVKKEKNLKQIAKFKWAGLLVPIAEGVTNILIQGDVNTWGTYVIWLVFLVPLILAILICIKVDPTKFCTFEQVDIDEIIK